MTDLRGPAWGNTNPPEEPEPTPRINPTHAAGIFLSGATLGWAAAALTLFR